MCCSIIYCCHCSNDVLIFIFVWCCAPTIILFFFQTVTVEYNTGIGRTHNLRHKRNCVLCVIVLYHVLYYIYRYMVYVYLCLLMGEKKLYILQSSHIPFKWHYIISLLLTKKWRETSCKILNMYTYRRDITRANVIWFNAIASTAFSGFL